MAIVSSTIGSPTKTGWKRRSRAASFSMYLRYSSSVVAPMQRSSPRARAGLSRLAASLPPSAAPAPTTVCSSSMNRITLPAADSTSRSTALSRSSNSPRNFVPAIERAHVERDDALVLQALGHVALHDPQGQPFGDGRLADARLADQHGIVLRPPREHLDHAADFLVAADHRVELALPGPLDQVDAVFFEGLELALRVWSVTRAAAADRCRRLQHVLLGDGVELEDVLGLRVDLRQREQQMLGRDELVLHRVGFALGGFEHLGRAATRLRRRRRR